MISESLVIRMKELGIVPPKYQPVSVAGRLCHFVSNWERLTKDRWILSTVQGYRIEFISTPIQTRQPLPTVMSSDELDCMEQEVRDLLGKEAVSSVPLSYAKQNCFLSNMFLVPKKDGGQRPVVNLKNLNSFVKEEHFKMEGIHTLKDLLMPEDWMCKVDLKDAYFSIPVSEEQRNLLTFRVGTKFFQFNCLPFGLSSAPWVFTKTLKPVVAYLRQLGVRLIIYIDDILIMARTESLALSHVEALQYLLENLGFIVNTKKSIFKPVQAIEFLGLTVSSRDMTLYLPGDKMKSIRADARRLLGMESVTARDLARLIGKMNATTKVIPPAPLFYRQLQRDLARALERSSQAYSTSLCLSLESKGELIWWDTHMSRWNGKALLNLKVSYILETDASMKGWGALNVTEQIQTGGAWSNAEAKMHINCLELLGATLAVKTFLKDQRNVHVLLRMDNTTAVAYVNHLGGTVSQELVSLTKDLWLWCLERNIHMTAQHLPGSLNCTADMESRVMRDRTDWKLHPDLFQRLNKLWGPLEVDLFASRLSAQLPAYYSWRPDPYVMGMDAFVQSWTDQRCYANSPWNLIGRVLAQAIRQRAEMVLVTPVWKTQAWYATLLELTLEPPRPSFQ